MYRILRGQRRGAGAAPPGHPPRGQEARAAGHQAQRVSWDITKLRGPAKWTYYYLYVILDVYSRYVVGWMLARAERRPLAERLIADTIAKQDVARDQLTVHADRGASMTSKPVAFLLADLGVTKTHTRPHVSNDNPYSESQFKTLKYRPDFPDRFGSIEDAQQRSAASSSVGTTTSTATPASRCTRPPTSTTAAPRPSKRTRATCSTPPTPHTPSGSCASHPPRPRCPMPRGSTSPTTTTPTQRIPEIVTQQG